jgi:hypothetical protein
MNLPMLADCCSREHESSFSIVRSRVYCPGRMKFIVSWSDPRQVRIDFAAP